MEIVIVKFVPLINAKFISRFLLIKSNNLPLSMSSKCGDGMLSQNFHLECIDLKERNGVVLGDIRNNENSPESPKKISTPSKYYMAPPKVPPPPPPIITQH